ncbi:hypothetical protein BURKHO8Y_70187 [Burkholderia sp. 8Y]|nr:hypothetical protein [Burkholderia sp. 8Y]VXC97411.1 hypothetical protein BURKHO8Y_70187 [Burkholderia sp. 8Y]
MLDRLLHTLARVTSRLLAHVQITLTFSLDQRRRTPAYPETN